MKGRSSLATVAPECEGSHAGAFFFASYLTLARLALGLNPSEGSGETGFGFIPTQVIAPRL